MTDQDRRNLSRGTDAHDDPDASLDFSDGMKVGAAFAFSLMLGLALIALGAAIYMGEF